MTQAKKKLTVDKVLRLVDQLSDTEQEELRQHLNNKSWGDRWDRQAERIQSRFAVEGPPLPTEEEVMAEVKAVREERRAERA